MHSQRPAFSNKTLVIQTWYHKMIVKIANRQDTDQAEAAWSGSALFV